MIPSFKPFTKTRLALLIAALAAAGFAHAGATPAPAKEIVRPGAADNINIQKPGTGIPPAPVAQITGVTYKQNPLDPQYVTYTIAGSGNAANCIVDVTLPGTTSYNNYKLGSFANTPTWYAPTDGAQINVKAVSGCAGSGSATFHKLVIDPNLVGTVTAVVMNKAIYKQGEGVGLTMQGMAGPSACLWRLSVDGNYAIGAVLSTLHPLMPPIANVGQYSPGLHTVTLDGPPNAPAAPGCKGNTTATFKVQSIDPNAPTITSVTATNGAQFKAGQAQAITVSGTGNCQYRLEYNDGFKSNNMQATAVNPLPHTLNVHPISNPGNYIVTAVTLGNCNGGSGAAFNVSP